MKKLCIIIAFTMLMASCGKRQPHPRWKAPIKNEVLLKYTPVKQQGNTQLCWLYAMLATIETERLMQGDSVNLSPAYIARNMLHDEALHYYLSLGKDKVKTRGIAPMALQWLEQAGAMPFDSYDGNRDLNDRVVARKLMVLAQTEAARRTGLKHLNTSISDLLDREMGFLPRMVFMLGAQYTPREFAHSVCLPGEYECLTSFSHHPFGERFVLEVPDNTMHHDMLNMPIDSLMATIEHAIRKGHPVCWEGDTSEPGFSFKKGMATLEKDYEKITQYRRQQEFEKFLTTDDHAMELVGLARDSMGRKYFIAKNSWGTSNPYGGLMYLSWNYVKLKTTLVVVAKEALPH